MKIKFNSDDGLLLNKLLKFHFMTLIIRCVFSEDGKFYLQRFYVTLCMNYKNATVRKN